MGHISTLYVGGPRNCLEGFFFEKVNRSTGQTGQRVNGSNGSTGKQVTFTFTILYMIADDARLTPNRCKKHMAYDDTRLTPHHCKKHTVSFARSTGKFPSPTKAWSRVHIDYAGPVNNAMYLVSVDAYSKFPEVVKMSSTTSIATIQVLREIFARYGLPEILVSDNGPQLKSVEFEQFCVNNGILHTTSAIYKTSNKWSSGKSCTNS